MKRFEVTWKRRLNHNMVWLKIYAPLVAKARENRDNLSSSEQMNSVKESLDDGRT